jgi:hypothetical protein
MIFCPVGTERPFRSRHPGRRFPGAKPVEARLKPGLLNPLARPGRAPQGFKTQPGVSQRRGHPIKGYALQGHKIGDRCHDRIPLIAEPMAKIYSTSSTDGNGYWRGCVARVIDDLPSALHPFILPKAQCLFSVFQPVASGSSLQQI